MQPRTRCLPDADLAALLGVVAVLDAHLINDELPPDLTQRLIRHLTQHGPLADGSTPGALHAALSDLAQRLHWAMSMDMDYPSAMAHRTRYQLTIPAGSVAACIAALREAGAEEVYDGPLTTHGWEMRPTGPNGAPERHSTDFPDGRTVFAVFPELAPDPAYQGRIAQLGALAERYGGQYAGAGWL
jgi:hypothetical protein